MLNNGNHYNQFKRKTSKIILTKRLRDYFGLLQKNIRDYFNKQIIPIQN